MPLNKTQLKNTLRALADDLSTRTDDAAQAREDWANGMANAIDTFVKTAKINYVNGLVAGATAVTGTYNGTLS